MRILVANDDGIYSPGIAALARAATAFGDVRVVAPDVEQSAAGHSITAARPLSYKRTPVMEDLGVEAYRVNGTPADCVALGMFQWDKVDVVLSGINLGTNLGNGAWHSGTVAAARQAALFGVRGIAFSTPVTGDEPDFDALAPHVHKVLDCLLPKESLELVNVNVPRHPRGMRWTRQAIKRYDGKIVPAQDPMGRQHYWFTVVPIQETEPETDLWAVQYGYTSITPLEIDVTDHEGLEALRRAAPLEQLDEGPAEAIPEQVEEDES
ncbi:MAG TPA: 5'/3'-nucleotidase SurE [Candidatus Limnocylindria bacterium]|nr:5'/3'-nucleotidase SurE [Candidatus Limnocylindria bacterium]